MKILILGAGKSGTTALMYGIKQQLPDYNVIFEPASLRDIDYSQENLIVKSLKAPNWEKEKEYFANFDRKILLIRNPYDRLISYLLYKTYDGGGLSNDNLASKYIELLKRKTDSPQSVSVLEIIDLFKRLTGTNVIEIFQEQYNQILALSQEGKYGFKIFRYEDFVDGFVEELEDYLGIKLEDNSNIEVDKKHQRVTRTKKYGDWKNWFTEKDLDEFSKVFQTFNEQFNYNDKNLALENATINPEYSYLYVIRIINEYRRLNYLPEYEDGQIKMDQEGRIIDNAINFIKKEEWSKAEATLSRALKINPSLAGIHLIQGKMFIRQNKLQEAETAIFKALELNPALSSSAEEQLERISARKARQEKQHKTSKSSNNYRTSEEGNLLNQYAFTKIDQQDSQTIYLHIGRHKTGSTTIQAFLKNNRDVLRRYGYLSPQAGSSGISQHNLAWQLLNNSKFKKNRGNWESLHQEIEAKGCPNIMISSEAFDALDRKQVEKLRLEVIPYNVKIIVYLRRQDKLMHSHYSNKIKTGNFDDSFADFLKKEIEHKRFKFYEFLEPWKDNFGIENILVRPLESDQLVGGTLIQDFLNCINFPVCNESEFNIPDAQNVSPSPKTIEIIRHIASILGNKMSDCDKDHIRHRYLVPILDYSNENSWNTEKFNHMTQEEAIMILNYFEECNSKIAKEYLLREDGRLFYEHDVDNNPVTKFDINEMTNEEILEIILVLLEKVWKRIEK